MDLNFSSDEVKKHLHELGYKSIPEGKLESFLADLRRLIKYEERKRHLDQKLDNLENIEPEPIPKERSVPARKYLKC